MSGLDWLVAASVRVLLCEEQMMNRVRLMATAMECFCISQYSGYALGEIGWAALWAAGRFLFIPGWLLFWSVDSRIRSFGNGVS